MRFCILAILCKNGVLLGKTWYSPKIIFLEIVPSNVIEGGESENQDPGARMRVVYAAANVVLENSKIVKEYLDLSNLVSNASSRWVNDFH